MAPSCHRCPTLQDFESEKASGEASMIARIWHGWTKPDDAAGYERVFRTIVLPHLHGVAGCEQAFLLRRDLGDEVEFAVLTIFESIEAVKRLAGEDYEVAVISDEAKEVLEHFEPRVTHYEIAVANSE
jgi:heme-degrading monooxygenase HmoA